jgi:hypothetical protein
MYDPEVGIAGCWNGLTQTSYWSTFFMLLSGKILFCDSESESNSDESVLTIPVGEFQRWRESK